MVTRFEQPNLTIAILNDTTKWLATFWMLDFEQNVPVLSGWCLLAGSKENRAGFALGNEASAG
jgi:hypothetical protein